MIFGIPSYLRSAEQSTAKMLSAIGIPRERIVISTQNEADRVAYEEKWSDISTIIFRPGRCVSDNRNTILEYCRPGERLVMLDDDISSFRALAGGGKLRNLTGEEFVAFCEKSFSYCADYRAAAWGLYPVENAFYMSRKVALDALLIGTTLGLIVQDKFRFDADIMVKEDYEYCCKIISSGQHTLRFNHIAAHAKHRTNKGGCHDHWGGNESAAKKLLMKYPDIVRENPRRPGELLKI
jgi:hypothetical protein